MFMSHARDISPDFEYNFRDAKLIKKILKQGELGSGIKEFCAHEKKLTDYSYWFILGTLWVDSVDGADLSVWKRLFRSNRKKMKTSLMKPSEVRYYNRLPQVITVFRAKRKGEEDCIAYTLDPVVAAKMAFSRATDVIYEYTINKADVSAVFLRRGESEVLVLDSFNVELVKIIDIAVNEE